MADFLASAVTAHMAWRSRLMTAIEERRRLDATAIRSDCNCALGKWLYGEGQQHADLRTYGRLREQHRIFHARAADVVELIAADRVVEARASILSGPFHQQSTVTIEAIDDLRQVLSGKRPTRRLWFGDMPAAKKLILGSLLIVGSSLAACGSLFYAIGSAGLTPQRAGTLKVWVTVVAAIMLVGQTAMTVWQHRSIAAPLKDLIGAVVRLERGDTEFDTPVLKRRDEIGALSEAVHAVKAAAMEKRNADQEAEKLRAQVEKEREQAQQAQDEAIARERAVVAQSFGAGLARLAAKDLTYRISQELPEAYRKLQSDFNEAIGHYEEEMRVVSATAQMIDVSTNEIATAANDMSRRTETQAAALEQTAAALHEITATVEKSAQGAAHARRVASIADDDAKKGAEVMRQAVQAMAGIAESASQIAQIIGVIDEIAFQTNLLALNAGVEAARAGEAGRGFAVVASEVRALALRSAGAAKEIKELISASSAHVDRGVELVSLIGKSLEQIGGRVAEINEIVIVIASGATEQATAITEVNTAIAQMDQATQQNATMAEQSTAATHSLASETSQLADSIRQFKVSAAEKTARGPRSAAA